MNVFTIENKGTEIRHLPLTPRAHKTLEDDFRASSLAFFNKKKEKTFQAGYDLPEADEYLSLKFTLPPILKNLVSVVPDKAKVLSPDEIKLGSPDAFLVTLPDKPGLWCFQAMDSRNFIRRKGKTFLTGKNTFDTPAHEGLVFDSRVDAVFKSGKLYFRSSHMVRRFLDISDHVTELSNTQLEAFFTNGLFEVANMDNLKVNATGQYRKKLAMVQDSLKTGTLNKAALKRAAVKVAEKEDTFRLKLKIKEGKVVVPEDKHQFEDLVKLLNNDYLEAIGDDTKLFYSSSKRRL